MARTEGNSRIRSRAGSSAAPQESRPGIVSAREEERHRLRRDLHDGHGPALTGIALKAGTVAGVAAQTPSLRPSRCLPRPGRVPGTTTGTGCMHARFGPSRQATRSPRNQALAPAITGAVTGRCPRRVADPAHTMPIGLNQSPLLSAPRPPGYSATTRPRPAPAGSNRHDRRASTRPERPVQRLVKGLLDSGRRSHISSSLHRYGTSTTHIRIHPCLGHPCSCRDECAHRRQREP
jgi:hypothetical protein